MKIMNKMKYASAFAVTASLPLLVHANEEFFNGAKEKLSGLETGIIAVGVVGIGLVVTMVAIGIVKSAIRKSA